MAAGARWFCWIDPITYAFRAIIPPQFFCEGPNCPLINNVTPQGTTVLDRYAFISSKYDVYEVDRWTNLGYLAIFIIFFQLCAWLATRVVRHLTR